MDTSQPDNSTDQQDSTPETPIVISPVSHPTEASPIAKKAKWYKSKKLVSLLVIFLFLTSASAAWYLTKINPPPINPTISTVTSTKQTPPVTKPYSAIYAEITAGPNDPSGQCATSQTKIYYQPIGQREKTETLDLGKNNGITYSDIKDKKISIVSQHNCGSKDGDSIWFSQDSGKTYKKLFTGSQVDSNNLSDQITSIKFSSDGKKLLFAFLKNNRTGGNSVKQIDTTTGKIDDIFTVKGYGGVFISGYDSDKNLIYYAKGCYNCDGNPYSKIFVHDVTKKSDALFYEDSKFETGNPTIKSDFSKFLLPKATPGTGLGGGAPYYIYELNVANKTVKKLADIKDDYPRINGYRTSDNMPYYANGNKIYLLDAKHTVLYDAEQQIQDVFLFNKDVVIASSGKYENFVLNQYSFKTKENLKILEGANKTTILGIINN